MCPQGCVRKDVSTRMCPQGCVRKDVSARMCPQGGCLGRASLSTSRYSQRHLSDEGSMLQFQGSGRRFIPRHLIFGKHVAWESTLFRKARYSRKHVAQRMDFSSERQRRRNGQGQAPVRSSPPEKILLYVPASLLQVIDPTAGD